jgi:alcohol dehydrogenase (cytochrome c)
VAQMRSVTKLEEALTKPGGTQGYQVVSVELKDGRSLRGFARNESGYDLQLQDFEGHFHFLEQSQIARIVREKKPLMPAVHLSKTDMNNLLAYIASPTPPQGPPTVIKVKAPGPDDWATYNGQLGGNRYSPMDQINLKNVSSLAPRWTFALRARGGLETTPVVVNGLMIVTSPNEIYALDASSGREVWHFQRRVPRGKGGEVFAANRGVAVLGDKIFMGTPDAHLLCVNMVTGGLVWDVTMGDYHKMYRVPAAPMVVDNLVISGMGYGDIGTRGFVAAYDPSTGKQVWKFYTVPLPGGPHSDTWIGGALKHGGGATWMTGTYDAENDILYWTIGNPCPDFNGDERKGDNLFTDSVVALKPETGKMLWYFQFTPHDTHDWDAQETPLLVDAMFNGKKRHLLLQANRNGFFYVLDRLTGQFLMGTPFVHKLTWASGIGPDGRPKELPNSIPTLKGALVCPSSTGATNWMSPAWSPQTQFFYVQSLEMCNIYVKGSPLYEPGKPFYDQMARPVPGEIPQKILRAINIQTGKVMWKVPQMGTAHTWGGVLATGGGLVFFCDDSGAFAAVDAKTGKPVWHFNASAHWRASPMTYEAKGKQYIAVAADSEIIAFGM